MAIAAAVLVLALSSCQGSGEPPEVGPQVWTVGQAPALMIGDADGARAYLFSGISAVRLLPDGRLVVADGGSNTLRVFEADGRVERQFGGEGDGPGEFKHLGALRVLAGDTLVAYDPEAYRLSTFLVSGELVSTVRIQADDGYPEVYLGRDSGGQDYFAWIQQGPRDPTILTPDLMEVGRFGPDGTMVASLGVFPGMRRRGSPLPFSPHFVGALLGGVPFVGDGSSPEVTAVRPGGLSVIPVRGSWTPWAAADAWTQLEALVTHPALQKGLQAMRSAPGADSIPAYSDILADTEGRLWLKRFSPTTDSHFLPRSLIGGTWVVADAEGEAVATVALPEDFRLLEISGDRIAGVSRDELGVERVAVYSLQRSRSERD